MKIYADIARRLSPEHLETLARFRAAAKDFEWLPTGGDINLLPSGFLGCQIGDAGVIAQLNPFGMLVAMAAEKLAAEEAA